MNIAEKFDFPFLPPPNSIHEKQLLRRVEFFHDVCISYKYPDAGRTLPEYKTGSICGNIIGDRIRYIKEHDKRVNYTAIAQQAGIGRNSLMRYLRQDDPDIPKPKTLLNIITKGLHCTIQDFCYSPENFSEWEKEFSKTLNISITKEERRYSYEELKNQLQSNVFYGRWTYEDCGKQYPIPNDIMDFFKKQISATFTAIEYLLDYEIKSNKPRGFVEPYLIESLPGLEDD